MQVAPGWKLAKQTSYTGQSFLKMKQTSDNSFLIHFPLSKKICSFDFHLNYLNKKYDFAHEMNAIQNVTFEGVDYVAAGCRNGQIIIKKIEDGQTAFVLQTNNQQQNEVYINDILCLGQGKLVNCLNDGSLNFWDLSTPTSHLSKVMPKVHKNFTYKIRRIDEMTLLTCGNDKTAKIIDLQKMKVIDTLWHNGPVWCSYPVSQTCVASVGLLRQIVFWDLRTSSIVQRCQLERFQSSFVTRLNERNVVFGDRQQIARCDLRKPKRLSLGNMPMKVSAEAIIVTNQGGICAGRGGDICRFVDTQEQIETQHVNQLPFMNILQFLQWYNHIQQPEDQWEEEGEEDQNILPNGHNINLNDDGIDDDEDDWEDDSEDQMNN